MIRAVLFDLDNTLYPELSYVRSGFAAVAQFLADRFGVDGDALADRMFDIVLEHGRGKVFNLVLDEYGLAGNVDILTLIYVYRSHLPSVSLYGDVLEGFRKIEEMGLSTGIITDARAGVQKRKIEALRLEDKVNMLLCTDDLGADFWKPSPVPFQVGLEYLSVAPEEAIYVGDDLEKDMRPALALGMHGLWMQRPDVEFPGDSAADFDIVRDLGDVVDFVRGAMSQWH